MTEIRNISSYQIRNPEAMQNFIGYSPFGQRGIWHLLFGGGWDSGTVNTGAAFNYAYTLFTRTGLGVNSEARLYTETEGFVRDAAYNTFPFDKRAILVVNVCRSGDDAQVVARFQIKTVNTSGALAASGFGIEIQNRTFYGEGYRTARNTVALGYTQTNGNTDEIWIDFQPSIPRIDFWVNGSLLGYLDNTNNIPNTPVSCHFVQSIINGAAGGVNCAFLCIGAKLWTAV